MCRGPLNYYGKQFKKFAALPTRGDTKDDENLILIDDELAAGALPPSLSLVTSGCAAAGVHLSPAWHIFCLSSNAGAHLVPATS